MSGLDFKSGTHLETGMELQCKVKRARHPLSDGGVIVTEAERREIEALTDATVSEALGLYLADRRKQQIDRRGVDADMNDRLRLEVEAFLEGRDRAGHRNASASMYIRLGKRKRTRFSYQKTEARSLRQSE